MSYFINSPINHTVTSSALSLVTNPTFHRVVARVTIGGKTYTQSLPVNVHGQKVEFDLSSSMRAHIESLKMSQSAVTSSQTYSAYSFTVKFTDDYMSGGKAESVANSSWSGSVIVGGYTDMERLRGVTVNAAEDASLSLRPSGSQMLYPKQSSVITHSRYGSTRTATLGTSISGSTTPQAPAASDAMFDSVNSEMIRLCRAGVLTQSQIQTYSSLWGYLSSRISDILAEAKEADLNTDALKTVQQSLISTVTAMMAATGDYTLDDDVIPNLQQLRTEYTALYAQLHPLTVTYSGGFYPVADNGRFTAFQFINTRGLHESAFALSYSSESIKGGSQTHVRALRETLSLVSRGFNVNDPANAALSFSSGFVDLPMARWWAYEFGKAKRHWMLVGTTWVPCRVTVKDGASIINRTKTELLSVEFDVVPDVNGMI